MLFPSPHHVLLPLVSVSSTCHFYRAVSVCIHACVFPILSRAVVLLYMGLTPATAAARVSHHLYVFALLSYDDVPSLVWCYFFVSFISAYRKKVKSSDKNKAKFNTGHEVVRRYTLWYDKREEEKGEVRRNSYASSVMMAKNSCSLISPSWSRSNSSIIACLTGGIVVSQRAREKGVNNK
jgi:hypothetical protein